MDEDLQEMLDHHRIRKTLALYCRGSDRCDEKLMAGIYARESWDDHGIVQAPGLTRAAVPATAAAARAGSAGAVRA